MQGRIFRFVAWATLAVSFTAGGWSRGLQAQQVRTRYPSMAPVEQYLIPDRNLEIVLAKSAAPESISKDAEIMVLGSRGYETAIKGTNGFVCMVWRSRTAGSEDPDFWNPKLRAPICLNSPAARFQVPLTLNKTELVLSGRSKEQMVEAIKTAFDKKELPALEPGAMCYMLSKQEYLSEEGGRWRPHLMFFLPLTEPTVWGANLKDSPVIGFADKENRLTLYLIPVGKWSDGSAAPASDH